MRFRIPLAWIAALLLAATLGAAGEDAETFGEAPTEELELTPIESLLEDPDSWEGQLVRISGEVSGVCAKRGCWMDLTSASDATLRVKVDDGVIVFPQDAVGRQAEAAGRIEIVEMEREAWETWLRHVAEEEARPFDPSEIGEGPYRLVRVRGTGARIAGP
jgi:hypothetical protein